MKHLFAVALILSASPLAAQQVVLVNSGEHEGFSRLVLRIDPAVNWEIVEARGEAIVRFPDQSLTFSTSHVFDRISTDRIAGVSEASSDEGSYLQLEFNCKCEVQSFAFKENYIVIDVFDGPALGPVETAENPPQWQPDALPFIQLSSPPSRFSAYVMAHAPMQPHILPDPPPQTAPEAAPQMAAPAMPDMVAEVEEQVPGEDDVIAEMETMAGAAVSGMNEVVETEDNPELQARIEEAQNQLLAQLTRAADQGLVQFVPAPVPVAEVEETAPAPEPVPEPPVVDPELMQQLSARTAYSQGTEDALTEIVNQFAMPQCMDDAHFSMIGWGGEAGFSDQLASLRSQLLGEFDTPNPQIAKELVQLYLRYGLGAEARLMLMEVGVELENAALYNDMAALIEDEAARVTGPILEGAGCGSAHEMWYLATGLGDYQVLEPLTITDVFSTYPIEVRALIGPPLAQAFISREQVEAGHLILEIVRRAESGVTTAQSMAEARVMEAQGDILGAASVYRTLALGNGENAPDALIGYARTLLASKTTLPETLLVDIESAAFFNRESENSDPLKIWEIKVRHEVAGAEMALAQIEEILSERPHLNHELTGIAAEIFGDTDAEDMGDYLYAQMVLRYVDMLDQGEGGDSARLKIAEEMAAIGLPESAIDVLAPNLARPNATTQHVEAAAYVQLFQPAQALVILEADESLAGYKIKLNAYLQLEDFEAVAQLLNHDHAKEISLNDVALRAGDWEKIQDAGAVGTLASYVQGENANTEMALDESLSPMMAEALPSLKAARALLAHNQESMQFLEGVLADGH
ncbi:MAG: hypothetical protein GQ535_09610 [Rhodobacteraceae bacterium]|nr:hypothetical protein [Paracoccaceae bacterium]